MARPKMPEKTRQEMFAHWVQSNNYKQTGLAFGYSANTVKNVVRDMPEYYAREHEHQRMEFVREAWLLARKALREIDRKLPNGDLKDVSVALGIISQRATNAMFAAMRANTPDVFVHNQQQLVHQAISADELLTIMREAKRRAAAEYGPDWQERLVDGKDYGPDREPRRMLPHLTSPVKLPE